MISAILGFFSAVVKAIISFFTMVIDWCREHPKAALAIAILACAVVGTWYATKVYTTRAVWAQANVTIDKLAAEVTKANLETKARDAKIAQIESDSKVLANAITANAVAFKATSDKVRADYEKKLAAEKSKNKVVVVVNPTTKVETPVEINPAGQVVCERLHDSLVESINILVDEINKPFMVTK